MRLHDYCSDINSLENLQHPLNTKIFIGPDSRVFGLRKDWGKTEPESIIFDRNGTYFHSWGSYFSFSNTFLQMDAQIVQHARKILERKNAEQYEENKKSRLKNRIFQLENDLGHVMQMIKQREENTKNQLDKIAYKLDRLCEIEIKSCL